MFLRLASILLIFVSLASARVITWTAYSEESQTAADEEAIAGVARHISAKVDASTTVSRSERESGDKSTTSKSILVNNSVRSDIFLKGIRLQKLPKDGKKFGTTATLDLDELTSSYRFKLETIQKAVSDQETQVQKATAQHQYSEAARLLNEIPGISRPYQTILDEMSVYVPLDNSMRLKSNASTLRESLVRELQNLKIQVVAEEPFTVKVSRGQDAISRFPLTAEHNGKPIASASTDEKGIAHFQIPEKLLLKPPHELTIIAELPLDLRKAAGIQTVLLPYKMDAPECKVNLVCNSAPPVCNAITSKLSDSFGQVVQTTQATALVTKIQTKQARALKNLTSYSVTLSLTHSSNQCSWTGTGTGRTEEEASASAIKKMDMAPCLQTLELCK